MNPEQLKSYKREKSRLFNAHLKALRLKDKENKKRTADKQDGNQDGNQEKQDDNLQDDNLTLQDLMDIFSTLDTKLDLIQTKLETIIETKLYEILDNKLDLIDNKLESIIETKLETKLETNQPINRQPSIFFA